MVFSTGKSRKRFFAKIKPKKPQKATKQSSTIAIDTKLFSAKAGVSKYGIPYGELGFGWKKSRLCKN